MKPKTLESWGILWTSENRLDGVTRHLCFEEKECVPALFNTRKKAREYIEARYGYIRGRNDLKEEPHGWKIPQVMKVKIEVKI